MSDIPFWSIGMPLAVAMVLACWIGWRGQPVPVAALLVLLVWVWLRVDKRFEGSVLVRVTEDHGLVLADLFGLAVLACAGVLLLRALREHRRTAQGVTVKPANGVRPGPEPGNARRR